MMKRKHKVQRKKRSPIWLAIDDESFTKLVKTARHIGDVLNHFGLENVGRNHYTAQVRIRALSIDTSHFDPRARTYGATRSLAELLASKTVKSTALKARLIRENILIERCVICGLGPEWNNIRLVLRLDHINGDRHDNSLENLRIVCPNCDTQLPTYCGRNKRTLRIPAPQP